jgi:RNA polymerase sigma factor (sigma-70 family)
VPFLAVARLRPPPRIVEAAGMFSGFAAPETSQTRRSERLPNVSKPPFEQVVTDHGPTVLRVVRAVVGPHDAEDAWSETFLSAMGAYPDLPATANVEAWLVTIAHRKAIDSARAAARRPLPVDTLPERPTDRGRPQDADIDLWRALRALPERQRHAVAYHYLGGLPYKKVAEVTGGTAEAVRRAAADGIRNLRGSYAADDETKR